MNLREKIEKVSAENCKIANLYSGRTNPAVPGGAVPWIAGPSLRALFAAETRGRRATPLHTASSRRSVAAAMEQEVLCHG